MLSLILAAILCNPCARDWNGVTLSDTPVLRCAAVSTADYWAIGALGVALLARPAGETTWLLLANVPHQAVEDDRGGITVYVAGLELLGQPHPDDERRYVTSTLPYHRYASLPAGEVWELAVVPYHALGYVAPIEVECQGCGCGACSPSCGYVRLCVYAVQTAFPVQGGLPCQ